MRTFPQIPLGNDFAFIGLSERWIAENPIYMKIFEFERKDFVQEYIWLETNKFSFGSLVFLYLGVSWCLQKWMKSKEAFHLRKPLFVWSSSLALLSMVMFSRLLPELIHINTEYGFYRSYCKRDHLNAATAYWLAVYLYSKAFEFFDTAFIILRKQNLTFLHIFHHASIFVAVIYGVLRGDPPSRYFMLMNTFVHSVMYTYYALKALNFKLPKKLAMAVTTVQLLQFFMATVINVLAIHAKITGKQPKCDRPNDVSVVYLILGIVYLYLFSSFFVRTYIKNQNTRTKDN